MSFIDSLETVRLHRELAVDPSSQKALATENIRPTIYPLQSSSWGGEPAFAMVN
jgi:hypothetical protein